MKCLTGFFAIFFGAAGVDFDERPRQVTIAASPTSSETCFDVVIFDDNFVESDEKFHIGFQILPGSNAAVGLINITTVTIIDNDQGIVKQDIH